MKNGTLKESKSQKKREFAFGIFHTRRNETLCTIIRWVSNDVIGDTIEANSKFLCYQNRLSDEVNIFVGRRYDVLRRDPETDFKVVKRKILLAQNVLLPKAINTFF